MKIKLCGFTDKKSIEFALKYKPDLMGFVFYASSKRNVSLRKAKEFAYINFGATKKVAIIVNDNDSNISKIIENLRPDLLQLHGEESFERCFQIKNAFKLPIIKAIAIADKPNINRIQEDIERYQKISNFLLFDAKTSEKGGAGIQFNWGLLSKLKIERDYFLSGGININNIRGMGDLSKNIIFDLSSGIEEKKGIKSLKKIRNLMEFFNELRKT
ncbi:MAG: phosphoribosylanthranilate isomerase [Rickettsiales bacterium]|jgi:phosphoribosylanthranilate isomerase